MSVVVFPGNAGRTLTARLYRDGRPWTGSAFAAADGVPTDFAMTHRTDAKVYTADVPAGALDGLAVDALVVEAGAVVGSGRVVEATKPLTDLAADFNAFACGPRLPAGGLIEYRTEAGVLRFRAPVPAGDGKFAGVTRP